MRAITCSFGFLVLLFEVGCGIPKPTVDESFYSFDYSEAINRIETQNKTDKIKRPDYV